MDDLTEYAEDQLRRLRDYMDAHPNARGLCVTASGPPLPAIWAGLEESGHVAVKWSDGRIDATVRPA
jgi:hypothetical protein